MSGKKIRVLVAEDSDTTRMFLVHLLETDPDFEVAGAVHDGEAAINFLAANKADVVLMDIYMPGVDGFEATRRIMETVPLPIVICSATADPRELDTAFRALEAGALACIAKPSGGSDPQAAVVAARLLETVKLMSEVRVVRRSVKPRPAALSRVPEEHWQPAPDIQMIGIGASTGGPPALQMIFNAMPEGFPAPILVVQHIAHGFLTGMCEWLNQTTPLEVQVAANGTVPQPGCVYLAPDGFQMGVSGCAIYLSREPAGGLRPSVSFLFRSMAAAIGPKALGVLLTGMGRDGADELKLMKDSGAVTIAQDRETSVVHGMPGEAITLGAAIHILPINKIAAALVEIVNHRSANRALLQARIEQR